MAENPRIRRYRLAEVFKKEITLYPTIKFKEFLDYSIFPDKPWDERSSLLQVKGHLEKLMKLRETINRPLIINQRSIRDHDLYEYLTD